MDSPPNPPAELDETAPFPLWDLVANGSGRIGQPALATPGLDALGNVLDLVGVSVDEARLALVKILGNRNEVQLVERIAKSPALSQQFLSAKLDARSLVKELSDLNTNLPAGRRLWKSTTSSR